MVKRVFIVHGWGYNPESNWYPKLKLELEKKKFKVIVLEMPDTDEPDIYRWTSYLSEKVGKLDSDTYFIGHSMGCQTIMRFLQNQKVKIGGALFVAAWFYLDHLEGKEVESLAEPWLKDNINLFNVKQVVNKLSVILSDNEPYGFVKENKAKFEKELGAKVVIEKGTGHFASEESIKSVPKILKAFLEMQNQ
jgi:predicted alpha/beta hydrolase family esterase